MGVQHSNGHPIRVFIGYDPRQPVAFQVAAHSVWSRSSLPVAITRLQLSQLPIQRRGLTEFTYSRYLAPYLCGFDDGYSVFIDSDMLCLGDVAELIAAGMIQSVTAGAAVSVVKHERVFERPSMMVFKNDLCGMLTPAWIDQAVNNPFDIPAWAGSKIGDLPREWNHLVGYDTPRSDAKLVHFTMGIPCWPETKVCEYSEAWHKEAKQTLSTVTYKELMGNSVHHSHVKSGALEKG